jgi:hypothetical protein
MENKKSENTENSDRYVIFLNEIIAQKAVWLLKAHDGLYAMVEDNNNQTYLPVWPEEKSLKEFATDDWEGYMPERMNLAEFLDWMQELKTDEILIGVYPNSQMQSLAVDPMELKKQVLKLMLI